MKTLNVKGMRGVSQQAGFTIIELVVVILLLGILTATALPRFIDVSDEAHASVVDAVRGGLLTANALYRAEFIAQGGANTTISGYPTVTASAATGYPNVTSQAECVTAFDNMLQDGHPSVIAGGAATDIASAGAAAAFDETATSADFLAYQVTSSAGCIYIYAADDGDRNGLTGNKFLQSDLITGSVTERATL